MLLLSAMSLNATADDIQTLTLNGQTSDKTVSRITFSGDNAVLTFTDQTTATCDMEQVKLEFDYTTVGISAPQAPAAKQNRRVYNLNGQYMGDTTDRLSKGVYVVEGKKVVIK